MPSFDIVCELNEQEIDNAVNQTCKELATRFDFKGSKSELTYDKVAKTLKIIADDELKLRALHQILEQKMAKRGIDIRCMEYKKEEVATGNTLRQIVQLKSGIDKESAKKITKLIKESELKVQAQIQDDQVRVTGKKIDDLQEVIALMRNSSLGMPLQFINMR